MPHECSIHLHWNMVRAIAGNKTISYTDCCERVLNVFFFCGNFVVILHSGTLYNWIILLLLIQQNGVCSMQIKELTFLNCGRQHVHWVRRNRVAAMLYSTIKSSVWHFVKWHNAITVSHQKSVVVKIIHSVSI